MRNDHSVFFRIHKKVIARVDTFEARLAVIDIVVALAIVTVEDTDRIYLFHLIILLAYVDMLRYRLAGSVKNTLQIIELSGELHFHNDQMSLVILGLDVDAIEFVCIRILI